MRHLSVVLLAGAVVLGTAHAKTVLRSAPHAAPPRVAHLVCEYNVTGRYHGVPFTGDARIDYDAATWRLTLHSTDVGPQVCSTDLGQRCTLDSACGAGRCIPAPARIYAEFSGTLEPADPPWVIATTAYAGVRLWFRRDAGHVLRFDHADHLIAFDRMVPRWCGSR